MIVNWTQEAVRAEDEYRREHLNRLASRSRWTNGLPTDGTVPARTGRSHRFLRWGGRPSAAETTG